MSGAKSTGSKQKMKDAVVDGVQTSSPPDSDQIREAAYYKWEAAGCPCCDGVEFWLAAEVEQARLNRPAKPK